MYSEALRVPGYISPFLLVIFLVLCLINPFRFCQHRSRRWLLRVLGRILRAPFCEVKFADFWLADQLNSMNFLFPDIAFFLCFYTSQINWTDGLTYLPPSNPTNNTGQTSPTVPQCVYHANSVVANSCTCTGILFGLDPILRSLPAWFRFAQCLRRYRDMKDKKLSPHIVNAGKYSMSFLVSTCIAWRDVDSNVTSLIFFIISCMLNSTYTYSWDIRMDWGLLECDSSNPLLREETVYQYKAYYYVAIVEDFILRYTWSIRLGLEETVVLPKELVPSVLAVAEVIRRFIWNFFRLENEHLNNCGEFRAVRDIFIRPERREGNVNAHNSLSFHKQKRDRSKPQPGTPQPDVLNSVTVSASNMSVWQKALKQVIRHRFRHSTSEIELKGSLRHFRTLPANQMVEESPTRKIMDPLNLEKPAGFDGSIAVDSSTPVKPDCTEVEYDFRQNNAVPPVSSKPGLDSPKYTIRNKGKISPTGKVIYFELSKQTSEQSDSSVFKSKDSSWGSDSISDQGNSNLHPTSTTLTFVSGDSEPIRENSSSVDNLRTSAPQFINPNNIRSEFVTASYNSLLLPRNCGRTVRKMSSSFELRTSNCDISSSPSYPHEIELQLPSSESSKESDDVEGFENPHRKQQ